MANLIFGEPSLFSINISTDDRFASVSIFCASEEIGDSSEYVLLSTFISLIKNKIDNYDYSLSNELFNLEKNDVFSYVVDGFEKAESWRESQRLESILITLNLAPCFDGETFIYYPLMNMIELYGKHSIRKLSVKHSFLLDMY